MDDMKYFNLSPSIFSSKMPRQTIAPIRNSKIVEYNNIQPISMNKRNNIIKIQDPLSGDEICLDDNLPEHITKKPLKSFCESGLTALYKDKNIILRERMSDSKKGDIKDQTDNLLYLKQMCVLENKKDPVKPRIVYTKAFLLSLRYSSPLCLTLSTSIDIANLKQLLFSSDNSNVGRKNSYINSKSLDPTLNPSPSPASPSNSWRNFNHTINPRSDYPSKHISSETAWKPVFLQPNTIKNEDKLYKDVRALLNKLTPHNFDAIFHLIVEQPVDTPEKVRYTANIIYKKAIDEPNYRSTYALLCKKISELRHDPCEKTLPFSKHALSLVMGIIRDVQERFEKEKDLLRLQQMREGALREIKQIIDDKIRRMRTQEHGENLMIERLRTLGNIRLIGELYNYELLRDNMIREALERLLNLFTSDEEVVIEELCQLLTTVGAKMGSKPCNKACLERIYGFLRPLAVRSTNSSSNLSSRFRFMIHDVLDLKDNGWIPRVSTELQPKTLGEIEDDMMEEKRKEDLLSYNYQSDGPIERRTFEIESRQIKSMIGLLEHNETDAEDTFIETFEDLIKKSKPNNVIAHLINESFERRESCRRVLAQILAELHTLKRFTKLHLFHGLKEVLREAPDLLPDYPHLYDYAATFCSHFLARHMLTVDSLIELVAITDLCLLIETLEKYNTWAGEGTPNGNGKKGKVDTEAMLQMILSKLNNSPSVWNSLNKSATLAPYLPTKEPSTKLQCDDNGTLK